jgi:hypothetical protein
LTQSSAPAATPPAAAGHGDVGRLFPASVTVIVAEPRLAVTAVPADGDDGGLLIAR